MTNVYQEVLTAGIANALNANPDNLQPVLQELPPDDAQIFSLLDLVPTDTDRTDFSTVFGTILSAQPPGALLTIAERNYENAANWINLGDRKVATYKPTRSDIVDTINRSQTIGYKSGSHSLKESTQMSRPPSVDADLNLLAEEIDWMNTQVQSLHLQLDRGTVAPIRPGPWFNPGVFTSAYKNKDWQPNPTSSSWEDVFGHQGDLQTIVTGVAVGSGLTLTMNITTRDQRDLHTQPAWPFSGPMQGASFEADLTVEVTVKTPPSTPLLLALEVQSIADLYG